MKREYYVYALKDTRTNPASTFYIGKGAGTRRYDHLIRADSTRKYARIQEILNAGFRPEVFVLVEDLAENEALKVEAELISAFGTIDAGGSLLNSVRPSGFRKTSRTHINVSHGLTEKAQIGLQLMKDSIVELATINDDGVSNSDAASALGLRSEHEGKQKDYLTYSVIGLLLREGVLVRNPLKRSKYIFRR